MVKRISDYSREEYLDSLAGDVVHMNNTVDALYTAKVPKDLGSRVDYLYALRSVRVSLDRVSKKLVLAFEAEQSTVAELLKLAKLEAASGEGATFAIGREKYIGQIQDWEALFGHIVKKKLIALPQKRLSQEAFEETLDDKNRTSLPGVEVITKPSYSLNKRG
jgi:hypothetical protein